MKRKHYPLYGLSDLIIPGIFAIFVSIAAAKFLLGML